MSGGTGQTLATYTAVFSLLAVVHLCLFGFMFNNEATSFVLMCAERGWSAEAKAKSCFTAGVLYAILLLISVVVRVICRRRDVEVAVTVPMAHAE